MAQNAFAPCKINLLLNVLGRRPDGFHELETVMCPVQFGDDVEISLDPVQEGVVLECDNPTVPLGDENLITRAVKAFFAKTSRRGGVAVKLRKRIPMAAGLGGGSSNAAAALSALNELTQHPLSQTELSDLAASLGSDVPFFLHQGLAIATGRGEKIQTIPWPPSLEGSLAVLAKPGFGVSTPWAYKALQAFPERVNGRPGQARSLVETLAVGKLEDARDQFFNSLETPAFRKYPLLRLIKEMFLREGATAALMSGSGASVFGLSGSWAQAEHLQRRVMEEFGPTIWSTIARLGVERP